jgi:hypothetical protein
MRNWKKSLLSALMIAGSTFVFAQGTPSQGHAQHSSPVAQTQAQKDQAGALIEAVRKATAGFQDFHAAEAAGYHLGFGCVSGPDFGAMGMHFINMDLVKAGVLDASQPQIVIYEPQPDGKLKLIGADFLLDAATWDKNNPGNPPQLMGQLFHFFDKPNRFGLDPFYTLHVWAWKENPTGAFTNWHADVSCQSFTGRTP